MKIMSEDTKPNALTGEGEDYTLNPDEFRERRAKRREELVEAEDKTTEQDVEHTREGSLMENEPMPEYPFEEQDPKKKKHGEPMPAPLNEPSSEGNSPM
jgi:hypothetical protein